MTTTPVPETSRAVDIRRLLGDNPAIVLTFVFDGLTTLFLGVFLLVVVMAHRGGR